MKLIGALLTLLTITWYVIQVVAQAKERQANEERAAEARRQQLARQQAQAQSKSQSSGSRGPASQRASGSPVDARSDLAERRRQQLEELRRRRAAQASGSSETMIRINQPGPSASATPPQSGQFNMGIAPVPTAPRQSQQSRQSQQRQPGSLSSRADALRRRPQQQSRRSQPQSAKPRKTKRQTTRRQQERSIQDTSLPGDPIGMGSPIQSGSVQKTGVGLSDVRSRLKSRAALREAFILKEVLDPPVSLRE